MLNEHPKRFIFSGAYFVYAVKDDCMMWSVIVISGHYNNYNVWPIPICEHMLVNEKGLTN